MNRILTIIFLFSILFSACEQTSEANNKTPEAKAPSSKPATPEQTGPVVLSDAYLPSIPMTVLQNLWTTCNQMDYIFYELPISSSVNDSPSAQAHLRHISDTPVSITEKNRCKKAIGRVFYKNNGEDLIESDIFFGGGCAFFVFYKKGKPTYSNVMTPAAVDHFNQLIAAANGKPIQ